MFAMEWWDEIRGARSRVTNREGDGNNHRNRSAEEETQRREKQQKLKDKQGERWEVLNRSKTCIDENEVDQSIWDLSVNQRQHDPCTTISSCLLFLINQSINQSGPCVSAGSAPFNSFTASEKRECFVVFYKLHILPLWLGLRGWKVLFW